MADVLKRVPVREQDPAVRAHNFDEVCLGYNKEEAMEEASRCLHCKNAKCVQGCPVSINIPDFVAAVKEGEFEKAYQVIGQSSALPAVCGRVCPQENQCEGKCIRGIKGEPVSIGKLERFVADWAKENVKTNKLDSCNVRYIVDDVVKFVKREIRRGNRYDAIIMDPPSYGRGANGEVWDIEKNLNYLVEICSEVLSDNPLFFLINSYTTGLSSTVLSNILELTINRKYIGSITCGDVGLPITSCGLVLPCGIYGRWESNE